MDRTPCCPSCTQLTQSGHCNEHTRMCIQRPGQSGESCIEPLRLNATRIKNHGNRDGQTCLSVRHILSRLRAYAMRWSNATRAGRVHSCLNGCSNNGICLNGWCSCAAGRWGIDCAHIKLAPASATSARRPQVLALYVHELPPALASTYGRAINKIYQAERMFLSQLLADWSVRVDNPDDADLFVVPFFSAYSPCAPEREGLTLLRPSTVPSRLANLHVRQGREQHV